VQANGFSPVWSLFWTLRLLDCLNVLSHFGRLENEIDLFSLFRPKFGSDLHFAFVFFFAHDLRRCNFPNLVGVILLISPCSAKSPLSFPTFVLSSSVLFCLSSGFISFFLSLSEVSSLCFLSWWHFSSPNCLNAFWHFPQGCGLSPVCVLTWTVRTHFLL